MRSLLLLFAARIALRNRLRRLLGLSCKNANWSLLRPSSNLTLSTAYITLKCERFSDPQALLAKVVTVAV